MCLILNIETSVKTCSVSLGFDGVLVSCDEIHSETFVHAEKLTVLIQQLFEKGSFKITELAAVCISSGPGSFTGLRIGVAVAKGLCFGLSIPLLQINSLQVLMDTYLASDNPIPAEAYYPMIDARRMEVFTAMYNSVGEEQVAPYSKIINESTFFDTSNAMLFFGDGADKFVDLTFHNKNIVVFTAVKPSASAMVKRAQELYNTNQFEDVAYFEPNYVKEFGETTLD